MTRPIVDLRSDTVTRPTIEMRRAMAEAVVGDDAYREDPSVNALEGAFATRLGKEAALFVPSGTMGNQLALRVLTRPGDLVLAGARQHVVLYENGASARNAQVQLQPLDDADGTLDLDAVAEAFEARAHHQPQVGLVSIENTHMAAGGALWPQARLEQLGQLCRSAGIPIHLDGARLWHAEVATGVPMASLAGEATTVMCCLSKGLAAPVGSLLAGPADTIEAARVERGRLGGQMRQAGILAAPGLVALGAMAERLAEDHVRARRLADAVAKRWPDAGLDPAKVQTNIVVFGHRGAPALLAHLETRGIRAGTIAPRTVRLVTHHDVNDEGIDRACEALSDGPDQ